MFSDSLTHLTHILLLAAVCNDVEDFHGIETASAARPPFSRFERLNKLGEGQKKRREEVAARRTTLAWSTSGRLGRAGVPRTPVVPSTAMRVTSTSTRDLQY